MVWHDVEGDIDRSGSSEQLLSHRPDVFGKGSVMCHMRRIVPASLMLIWFMLFSAPVHAAEPRQLVCLNEPEQSAAVAAHEAIPLGRIIKKLREQGHQAEVVRARLCRRNGNLDYLLTMLTHSGKVISVDLNAANGEFATGR